MKLRKNTIKARLAAKSTPSYLRAMNAKEPLIALVKVLIHKYWRTPVEIEFRIADTRSACSGEEHSLGSFSLNVFLSANMKTR